VPPSSSVTGVRCLAAAVATILATRPEPVMKKEENVNWDFGGYFLDFRTRIQNWQSANETRWNILALKVEHDKTRTHYGPIEAQEAIYQIHFSSYSIHRGASLRHTLVVSGTAPLTTRTRSLSKYFSLSSVINALVAGVDSEGFSSVVQPAAMAPACD
jgi:hypothetical protein